MYRMIMLAQVILFFWMVSIPQSGGGPAERDREGRAMGLIEQLQQSVEQYHRQHKAYPRDLENIKFKNADARGETLDGGVRDERSAVMRYESWMGMVEYGPEAGKEDTYVLRTWGKGTDEEYYAYTGDPFLYLRRIPREPGFAAVALLVLSLFNIVSVLWTRKRQSTNEQQSPMQALRKPGVAVSALFILFSLLILIKSARESENLHSRDLLDLRNLMIAAQAYQADHHRYPKDLRELTKLANGRIWIPYGYSVEYGPIDGQPKEYALRAVRRDSVYELFTDRAGLYHRKKHEKEEDAKLM
ncbi:MAG: hypothetical protein OEW15_13925 [Nitrospirota bacterium]|nr:hypothetical protein [Nitrospirota bacterium]